MAPMRLITRILLMASAIELLLGIVLVRRGFPYVGPLGGGAFVTGGVIYWWERAIAAIHAPGIALLSSLGMCCGYSGGPIGDEYIGGHTPISASGAVVLGIANVLAWGFPAYLVARVLGSVWLRRFGKSAAA
jgi:hypothetical protein